MGRLARLLLVIVACGGGYASPAAPQASLADGERLYRDGMLPSGQALRGERGDAPAGSGATVACVACHRRSGLGSAEGTVRIPPITSTYLFARSGVQAGRPTLTALSASEAVRAAYDDRTLASAIRAGAGRGGQPLSYLMPRYALDDDSMASLIHYLKSLPTTPSPGVSDTTIDLATIVTPDADPVERDGMLSVLDRFVTDKNAFIRGGAKPLRTQGQIDYRVTRRWQLHVWTLEGPPDTWEPQLRARLKSEPVFAVLSGIGGSIWSPVHHFCESERVPCIFPNVELPVDAEADAYDLYLSKGVLLEAEMIASRLNEDGITAEKRRVVQVFSPGGIGEAAAKKLQSLDPGQADWVMRPAIAGDGAALARAITEAHPRDALILWLKPSDLALLGTAPPPSVPVFVSGVMGGLESAPLPAAWRRAAQLTYPVDLPDSRAIRMNYPLRWFKIRQVAVVAEKVQSDTYLACGVLAEAVNDMQESFMRDFLVERIESMVSHRQLSGYYPRLGLAPGQRFASKGGYFVQFTGPGSAIAPASDWIVP